MNDLINDPNASRLIYGLRDTGYNVKTAAADIIDNSIAARSTGQTQFQPVRAASIWTTAHPYDVATCRKTYHDARGDLAASGSFVEHFLHRNTFAGGVANFDAKRTYCRSVAPYLQAVHATRSSTDVQLVILQGFRFSELAFRTRRDIASVSGD